MANITIAAGKKINNQNYPITGTFIQLDNETLHWDSTQWKNEFQAMKDVGMDILVIQFSGSNQSAYYPSKSLKYDKAISSIPVLLDQADKMGIQVYIGLLNIHGWWSAANHPDWFPKALALQKQTVLELQDLYGKHTSFIGWYLPEEIDDLNWQTKAKQKLLIEYLSPIASYCHEISGNKPVMTAPFTGWNPDTKMYMTPKAFENMWENIFTHTQIDIVALQDASTRAKYHKIILPPYFKALQKACAKSGAKLWSDLEIFEQVHGWPIDKQQHSAEPASLNRIKNQITLETPLVENIICFEFNHYMSPYRGEKQKKLYEEYLKWVKNYGKKK